MKRQPLFFHLAVLALFALFFVSCEDSGPYEETTQTYSVSGFDRLDMGSAFRITVRPGTTFAVEARGNRSDVNDLVVAVRNGTLTAQYDNYRRNRRHDMFITITMPTLRAVSFSGASRSTISGFPNVNSLDINLTGASKADVAVTATRLTTSLSGASALTVNGSSGVLIGDVSGASKLNAYDLLTDAAELEVSGASNAQIRVKEALTVTASGASKVRYRGTPRVNSKVSGASSVEQE
ncbi:DUF2807 domain-containing protein [Fibrisoma montanum]|uniref:DUF2807 domain-containing protein n=1 Tax=Fibrisoma montanum TaxID=2305895 RepID=A0A418LYT6_9BACT|nr:head GIN domain-containing protein [Fibrisoma montanum]RIV18468.1 DUF2807 domain-containing protein [Fibrisoma montanum]